MESVIDTTVMIMGHYFPEDVKIRIIGRCLRIDAKKEYGVKGVNYTCHKFERSIKLSKYINIDNLRCFFLLDMIRIISARIELQGTELIVDKRRAKKYKALAPKIDKKLQKNYEHFITGLKRKHFL